MPLTFWSYRNHNVKSRALFGIFPSRLQTTTYFCCETWTNFVTSPISLLKFWVQWFLTHKKIGKESWARWWKSFDFTFLEARSCGVSWFKDTPRSHDVSSSVTTALLGLMTKAVQQQSSPVSGVLSPRVSNLRTKLFILSSKNNHKLRFLLQTRGENHFKKIKLKGEIKVHKNT